MTVRNVFRDDTMSTKAPDQTYGKSYDSYTINGFSLINHTNVYRHVHRHTDSVVVANCEYNPQDNIEAFVKSL